MPTYRSKKTGEKVRTVPGSIEDKRLRKSSNWEGEKPAKSEKANSGDSGSGGSESGDK